MTPPLPLPTRRSLQAYAYDPLRADLAGTIVTLDVPFEPLQPGPVGSLVKVVDFDPVRNLWYSPVDLDHALVLTQGGLAPSEADPRFHQQMVYAVASSVLEHFEAALGRRFRFSDGPMAMYPHAFEDQNAFYDPSQRAILFGYFRADGSEPGALLPGQTVFTCLSHDIIAHELTHAIVDRLRPRLTDPTGHDVAAFHEAFADLVALFHHFTLPDLVHRQLATSRADLSSAEALVALAQQFAEGAGLGVALRSGIDTPDPQALARTLECHDRGAILVGAIFSAFVDTYKTSIADLLRIATGGTGELPAGALHPDLVHRVAQAAINNATVFLTMCVRAIDYLPVVDPTFGDFLRALVTADRFLYPDDRGKKRATLIEAFRRRGIYPDGVMSLAEDRLVWPRSDIKAELKGLGELVRWTAEDSNLSTRRSRLGVEREDDLLEERRAARGGIAAAIHTFVSADRAAFGLHPDERFKIAVSRFHASMRNSQDGQPRADLVLEVLQERPDLETRPELEGTGIRIWAGTTIVADPRGHIRHVITKPLPVNADEPFRGRGGERFARICDFVAESDALNMIRPWSNQPDRIVSSLSFANLHRGRGGGLR